MKKTRLKSIVSLILCGVLLAAVAWLSIGCDDTHSTDPADTSAADTSAADTAAGGTASLIRGEGNTVFYFHVVDGDGHKTQFEIHTDKTIVGEALLELGLIAGDEGPYGLYVKSVNGITADPDKDKAYWSFYEGSTYANTGVDSTPVKAGATYMFKLEKY